MVRVERLALQVVFFDPGHRLSSNAIQINCVFFLSFRGALIYELCLLQVHTLLEA